MSERLQAPRGTQDVLGEQARARAALEGHARGVLEAAGYERIETPAFEATELFARGVGASTDVVQKEMYTFTDGGGRSLTLRPEGTAPICRAFLEHGMARRPAPVKLWYLSSFFRYERAQAGRYRQFWQIGAEVIGSADPSVDAETILLLAELLDVLGVGERRLRLSSLGSPPARIEYRERLTAHLLTRRDELAPEVAARIELNPLRAFDSDHAGTRAVMADAPILLDCIDDDDRSHFDAVRALLDDAGLAYDIDPTLVRGLDYYTRTVFEFESAALGAQRGVGGGGRYDGLMAQLGGPDTPACGWAAGVERILLAAGDPPPEPPVVDLYVGYAEPARRAVAFALARTARRAGLHAELELAGRTLKGQLKHADRLGARHVALVQADGVALKTMAGGEQRELGDEAAAAAIACLGPR